MIVLKLVGGDLPFLLANAVLAVVIIILSRYLVKSLVE